jgi:Secretion system C-terminal sorting domain
MKKRIFKILLLLVTGLFSLVTAMGQIMPPVQDTFAVYPANPSPKDSVYVAYSYISNDGCPDFILVKDSVVDGRVYVGKRNIDNSTRICNMMVSSFTAKLNLGLLADNTQIYFNGILAKTIHWGCIMDKLGVVIDVKGSSTLIKDSLSGDIYAINNSKLAIGTLIKFSGVKIECFTTPCYNLLNCYEIIQTPPPPCVMDKVGFVVAGIAGCADQMFIQELSPISSSRQLYLIKGNIINSNGTISNGLNVGDKVRFGGYLIKNDSNVNIQCRTIGVATCYEVEPTDCNMDKLGTVFAVKDGSTLIKDSSTGDIYVLNNLQLSIGTSVKFNGVKIQCFTTPCYNLVNCYEIVQTPPSACVMDKVGVVVDGVGGCTGQLFIEDTSYPGMSMIRQLYSIENKIVGTGITPGSGSVTTTVIYPIGLKAGDKVRFGGYLTQNDSNKISLCHTVGVATCYQIIETPACVMDKVGIVVPGIDGCTGKLFIQEYSPISSVRQLYAIKDIPVLNSDGSTFFGGLKAGDKVRFGGYLTKNDSSMSVLCYTVGVATCYEVINTENTYTFTGSVLAGTELIKSGYAVLFRKGYYKAITSGAINAGLFKFANLPKAEYTLYAIPDFTVYKNFLPTFYINKLKFKNADYLTLNDSVINIVIHLREFVRTKGNGKISGNIFFETYSLQDSVFAKSASTSLNLISNIAMNTPVVLYNNSNEPVAWTVTDMAGYYVFENIALDAYKVVAETASAIAESDVALTDNNSATNADLTLKSQLDNTGINNIENNVISIFPNPVADNLNIEVNDPTTLKMYTILGKLLFSENLKSGINTLNISTIEKGIYVAKIGNNTIRIVKN